MHLDVPFDDSELVLEDSTIYCLPFYRLYTGFKDERCMVSFYKSKDELKSDAYDIYASFSFQDVKERPSIDYFDDPRDIGNPHISSVFEDLSKSQIESLVLKWKSYSMKKRTFVLSARLNQDFNFARKNYLDALNNWGDYQGYMKDELIRKEFPPSFSSEDKQYLLPMAHSGFEPGRFLRMKAINPKV